MNVVLNMTKEKSKLLLLGTPSKNMNMTRMNLKNEKHVEKQWALKKPKVGLKGEGLHNISIFPHSP
jgi:hypothetical protein